MQKIIPCLWFDKEAEEAARLYTSIFKNSKIGKVMRYNEASAKVSGQPKDSAMLVPITLDGYEIQLLNGGPIFKPNPSFSLTVNCESEEEINMHWQKLSEGGKVLMELDKYPFSEKYGWLDDRYGISWQLILTGKTKRKIIPFLMFTQKVAGKAEEAINFYTSVFENSKIEKIRHYTKGSSEPTTSVEHGEFELEGEEFMAMDSSISHDFTFSEANSLVVYCDTQEEVDYYWDRLKEGGSEVQCGWLKDKYGFSWQVVPHTLDKLISDPDKTKATRVMEAMLKMKKLDIAELEKAYSGK